MTTVSIEQLINKILGSKSSRDVFDGSKPWKDEYKDMMKVLHPDVCKLPNAAEAVQKLTDYKTELEKGRHYTDDAGDVNYFAQKIYFEGDKEALKKSKYHYDILMGLSGDTAKFFKQYIPSSLEFEGDRLVATVHKRAIPMSSIIEVQPEHHAKWMLSRMLEFGGMLNNLGWVHSGMSPDSLFLVPEDHGLICVSFYHMRPIKSTLKSVSRKWQNFYPSHVFVDKKATADLDIDMAKRIGIYMLGDKSGIGTMLRKTHDNELINFLQKHHKNGKVAYEEYTDLRNKKPKTFHVFNY